MTKIWMTCVACVFLLLGAANYAKACETVDVLKQVTEEARGSVTKLSAEDKQKVADALGPAPLDEPYDMHVMLIPAQGNTPAFGRIVLFKDGCLAGNSKAFPDRQLRELLKLEEARL